MAEAMEHAKMLAEAVRRVEGLKRELSIAEAQVKTLASEMIVIIDAARVIEEQARAQDAVTMVRPFVKGSPAAYASKNARLNAEPTFAWTPLADQLTREQPAARCQWGDCRELYHHFHDQHGVPHALQD